jgi:thioredoxin-related protein
MMALLVTGLVAGSSAAAQTGEGNGLVWHSIQDALATAGPQGKKILIDFYTDWCGWCRKMDRDTYSDSAVISYINEHFIPVKLNPEQHDSLIYDGETYTYRELARAMSVRGYPATGFLDEDQEMLTLISGYHDASRFLSFLQFFGGDHHLTTDYQTWVAGESGEEDSNMPTESEE